MAASVRQTIHSRAAIAGHPIHATMIHFPVAALIGVIGSDLGYVFTSDPFWARVGLWLAGVGALGGWTASLAGAIDLFTVREIRRMITAWCHALLAIMMLSLASLNWIQRVNAVDAIYPWGLYLSLLTGFFIAITGIFGGQLVYEHAVGVNVDD
jgi:uncharacterized membrane protein